MVGERPVGEHVGEKPVGEPVGGKPGILKVDNGTWGLLQTVEHSIRYSE
jgi:hypothetical protein